MVEKYLEITKVQLKHHAWQHLLVSILLLAASPLVLGISNLDAAQSAKVLETYVALTGIILFVPVFLPEQDWDLWLSLIHICYNSASYMRRCVDSLLAGGRDVEIILVNDGSTDRTAEIADEYQLKYPDIVRAVHKENGGHGSGVNKGLELARGLYYKVVDSDDWLDKDSYLRLLKRIKDFCAGRTTESDREQPDLIVCNYVYDHLDEGTSRVMDYRNIFPKEKLCTWNEIGRFKPSQYLIMHSLMFRAEVLRRSGVKLPEHTFYVDNLFSYQPLPYVESILSLIHI